MPSEYSKYAFKVADILYPLDNEVSSKSSVQIFIYSLLTE